jgi:hypothetical protein
LRTIQRKVKVAKELASRAKEMHKINTFFKSDSGTSSQETRVLPWISSEELRIQERETALKPIDKKLQNKKHTFNGQTLQRYEAVRSFLQIQRSKQCGKHARVWQEL